MYNCASCVIVHFYPSGLLLLMSMNCPPQENVFTTSKKLLYMYTLLSGVNNVFPNVQLLISGFYRLSFSGEVPSYNSHGDYHYV